MQEVSICRNEIAHIWRQGTFHDGGSYDPCKSKIFALEGVDEAELLSMSFDVVIDCANVAG